MEFDSAENRGSLVGPDAFVERHLDCPHCCGAAFASQVNGRSCEFNDAML
jgi:hypothetical protein